MENTPFSPTIMPILCKIESGPHKSWVRVTSKRVETSFNATLEKAPKIQADTNRPLRLAKKLMGMGKLRYPPRTNGRRYSGSSAVEVTMCVASYSLCVHKLFPCFDIPPWPQEQKL